MSFKGTKTPAKPAGKAKWQIPMRESPKCRGVMVYVLEGELKEKFARLYPKNSSRRMMEWFGVSFSTLHRLARDLGLKKDMKAIRRQLSADVKKTCERNGYYDSMRGKPVSEACKEGYRRLLEAGYHPIKALKEKNPRRYRKLCRKRGEARRELFRMEQLREKYGLERKTRLNVTGRPLTRAAIAYKSYLVRGRNYFAVPGHSWRIAYDRDTDRSQRCEATARRHGFEIVEGEDEPALAAEQATEQQELKT